MPKRKAVSKGKFNFESLIRNLLITIICVTGMSASLWVFREDMNITEQNLNEQPVGTVSWVNKTVQRLAPGHLQWNRVERFSSIYNGDLISSGPLSEVKINLTGGETLELFENTSVRVSIGAEIPALELLEGNIYIQGGRSGLVIDISMDDPASQTNHELKVNLEPLASMEINSLEDISFKMFQGNGAISLGNETRLLEAGKAVKVNKDSGFAEESPLLVLFPRNNTRILGTDGKQTPVIFQWQGQEKETNSTETGAVRLEIAKTRDFSELIGSWDAELTDIMGIELDQGIYYWRILMPPALEAIDSGRLDLFAAPLPRALSPANDSIQTIVRGKQNLYFYWSVPEEAEAVLLEVADNPEMNRPRIRQLIKRTTSGYGSFISSEIGVGQWYWRVYPVFPGAISEGNGILAQIGANHGFWRIRSQNANVMADDAPSQVNAFTVEETTEPAARPESSGGHTSRAVPGYSPRLMFPPDNFTLETSRTPDILFVWGNPVSYNARFQISKRSDFTGDFLMDEWVFGSSIRGIYLAPDTYYWRVTGNGPAGPGEATPTRLVVEPSLTAPELHAPEQNKKLQLESGKPVSFTWTRPFYANKFTYSLFLEGGTQPLAQVSDMETTSINVIFDVRTTGKFYWTVQGFTSPSETSIGRNGLVAKGNFSITALDGSIRQNDTSWQIPIIDFIEIRKGRAQSPIVLKSPEPGISIPGLEALRSPPEAQWTTEEPISGAQLIISTTSNPATDPGAIKIDATKLPVKFPALEKGTYYWIVSGNTANQRGATPGEIYWFKVLEIPKLAPPRIVQPEDASVIGMVKITTDRKITFLWEEVENANAYVFSLFQNGPSPTRILVTDPLPGLAYVLEDLRKVNAGEYYWQVEAVFNNENGTIEQGGVIEQHPFTIESRRSSIQTEGQGGTTWFGM